MLPRRDVTYELGTGSSLGDGPLDPRVLRHRFMAPQEETHQAIRCSRRTRLLQGVLPVIKFKVLSISLQLIAARREIAQLRVENLKLKRNLGKAMLLADLRKHMTEFDLSSDDRPALLRPQI